MGQLGKDGKLQGCTGQEVSVAGICTWNAAQSTSLFPYFASIGPSLRTDSVISGPSSLLITTRARNLHSSITSKTQRILYSLQHFIVHDQVLKQDYANQHIWRLNHEGHRSSIRSFGASYSWRRIEELELGPSMDFRPRRYNFFHEAHWIVHVYRLVMTQNMP